MADIDLSPDLDRFVEKQVRTGRFRDAAEVVTAGLRLLEQSLADEPDHRKTLLTAIVTAFDDPRPGLPAKEVFERLEDRHARRSRGGREP
ncbi:type II toxin-antitoxin system ParD family antitoxin [Methylobacterium pseudosasicola]|uniref:Antitoxin ParD1/3/4 n=1 Tax=Methylobacterium pseudosasicola TaxID=582667 RepID=A0A1I4F235_9HYPH|nr:type II toxin-antitoxin system ParD family antitoxin [Methylobacterium pseudosasicola]SFL11629.1 antitoxin ParD1/3/4 [Methylobacterium pseudosasicola]